MKLGYNIIFYPSNKLENDIYETRSLSRSSTRVNQFISSYPNKDFDAYIFIRQSKPLSNLRFTGSRQYIYNIEQRRIQFLKDNNQIPPYKPGQLSGDLIF